MEVHFLLSAVALEEPAQRSWTRQSKQRERETDGGVEESERKEGGREDRRFG